MPSSYTLNNGIELIDTGEQSGTWGDTTNDNLSFIDTALDGQVRITASSAASSGSPNDLPITNGTASNGRNRLVEIYSGTNLGGTVYYQLTPNDAEKIIYIRNSLNTQDLIVFQGTYNASNDYLIPNGKTAVIFFNGTGSGAVAANVMSNAHFDALNIVGNAVVGGTLDVTSVATATTFEPDGDTAAGDNAAIGYTAAEGLILTGQGSTNDVTIKNDADADVLEIPTGTTNVTIAGNLGVGGTVTGTGTSVFASLDISGDIDVDGTTNLDVVDIDGAVDMASTLDVDGTTTFKGAVAVTPSSGTASISFTSGGAGSEVFSVNGQIPGVSNTGFAIRNVTDSRNDLTIDANGVVAAASLDISGAATFNEGGANADFRVESDSNTHMLFVDASENAVKIGGSTTREGALQVFTTASGVAMEIESTNGSASQGPILQLRRTSSSPAGNDYLGALNFVGQDSGDNALAYVDMYTRATTTTDGSEESQLSIRTRRSGTLEERVTVDAVETTFNEVGGNVDFRVESDFNTHMIFMDAGSNVVAFGVTTSPYDHASNEGFYYNYGGSLDIASNTNTLRINRNGTGGNNRVNIELQNNGTTRGTIGTFGAADGLYLQAGNSTYDNAHFKSTATIFNESSQDIDFRVESDNNANMIYVDAGADHVNIGSSTDRGGLLNVDGATKGIVVRTTNSAAMELIHADNDAGTGPIMYLNRPSSSPAADDQLGRIVVQGKNSADEVIDYVRLVNQLLSPTDGSEQGRFAINTMTSGTQNSRLNIVNGESVFNDESVDVDFRVESNNNANMLLVDGENDRVKVSGTGGTALFNVHEAVTATDPQFVSIVNETSGQDARVLIGTPANSSGDPYVKFDGGGSNMIVGLHWEGTTNNKLMLGAADRPSDTIKGFRINGTGATALSATDFFGTLATSDDGKLGHFWGVGGNYILSRDQNSTGAESIIINNIHSVGASIGLLQYRTQNTTEGSINGTSSGIAITNISDYRKKENVANATGCLGKINNLRPVTYTHRSEYDSDTTTVHTGFIAHEVNDHLPSIVSGTKDAVDEDGNVVLQSVAYADHEMIANLVGAIKELKSENDAMRSRLDALEG